MCVCGGVGFGRLERAAEVHKNEVRTYQGWGLQSLMSVREKKTNVRFNFQEKLGTVGLSDMEE